MAALSVVSAVGSVTVEVQMSGFQVYQVLFDRQKWGFHLRPGLIRWRRYFLSRHQRRPPLGYDARLADRSRLQAPGQVAYGANLGSTRNRSVCRQ